ncbi:MAG: ABC transporter substrate-binding protein [Pseudomonadota bacterium]
MNTHRRGFGALLGGAALTVLATGVQSQPLTDVRFVLDWAWQSMHGPFLIALDKGYYEEAGLDVTIDRGFGSGDTLNKVAAKSYDIGFAEGAGLFRFNNENPDDRVVTILVINNQSPTGAIYLEKSGIEGPADLIGRNVSATQGEATFLVWPAVAAANGLDADGINPVFVESNLRDAMVIQGGAEATFGFVSTTVLNMVNAGVDREDIGYFTFAEFGLAPYSSGIQVRADYAEANPEVVRGFVEATVKGMIDMFEDPAYGIRLLKEREPLVNEEVETARWELAEELALLVPEVTENGIGYVDPERFVSAGTAVARAFGVDAEIVLEDYYRGDFLPPIEAREVPESAKARAASY